MTEWKFNVSSDLVKAFLDKVSAGLGGAVAPWQIERLAIAEGKAAVIRAEAEAKVKQIEITAAIEASDLQRRAALRWVA